MKRQVFRNVLFGPDVFAEIVLQDQLGVVAVSEEVALAYWFDLGVEKFVGMLVGELDHPVFKSANGFKKLV